MPSFYLQRILILRDHRLIKLIEKQRLGTTLINLLSFLVILLLLSADSLRVEGWNLSLSLVREDGDKYHLYFDLISRAH